MEDLRITTPRKSNRLITTKKPRRRQPKAEPGFFARVTNFFKPKQPIKAEARLGSPSTRPPTGDGDGGNEDDDDLEDEEQAARRRLESQGSSKPAFLDKFVPKSARKYTPGSGEQWDGTGQPPFTEGSVAWSEDRSRAASEVDDNVVDMILSNPSKLVKEPPVFFDPVEDQVRSRWLAVLAMCAFPTILATILLVDVWDNSTLFT